MTEKDNSKISIRYPERHNNYGQFQKNQNTAHPDMQGEQGDDKTETDNENDVKEDTSLGADGPVKS